MFSQVSSDPLEVAKPQVRAVRLTNPQKKPYTAVTVTIERLTSEALAVDDVSGIPDLVEVVNLQPTGPSEASRAIRKKLKYGNLHRQLRALTLLDSLIQNAGPRFQRTFADEALLERLRFCGTAALSDPEVKKKCSELFRSWAAEYKDTRGMEQVARLYKVALTCLSDPARFTRLTVLRNSLDANTSSRRRNPGFFRRLQTHSVTRMMTTSSPSLHVHPIAGIQARARARPHHGLRLNRQSCNHSLLHRATRRRRSQRTRKAKRAKRSRHLILRPRRSR
jgi:hypothetical protein